MNDIEKLLKLADKGSVTQKASEGNLGTTKIFWTINVIAMFGQYNFELPGIYAVGFEYVPGESEIDALAELAGEGEAE